MIATRRGFLMLAAAGLVAGGNGLSSAWAQTAVPDGSTIVLVRQADRVSGGGDVALSPAGDKRAKALREVLKDSEISAIVTTNMVRTRETARPLAEELNLTTVEIKRGPTEISDVEQAVRAKLPAAVLVVGHSDTVPDLVKAFGGPDVEVSTFDNLFIIIRANGMTQFIHGRYGAASH